MQLQEEIQNLSEIENEGKGNLMIKATGMNEAMIVDNKNTF